MNLLDGFKTGVFAPPFVSFPLGEEKFVSFGRTQTYDRGVPYLGGVLQNFYRGQEAHFARKLARFNRDLRMRYDNVRREYPRNSDVRITSVPIEFLPRPSMPGQIRSRYARSCVYVCDTGQ